MAEAAPRRGLPAPAWVLLAVVVLAFVLGGLALPNFLYMGFEAKRSEASSNLESIKTSLLSYDAAFEGFVYCGSRAGARAAVNKHLHRWIGRDDPCWTKLGWKPDGEVRCEYWIEDTTVGPDVPEFTVHGVCDLDADGEIAEYTVTRTGEVTLETGRYEF